LLGQEPKVADGIINALSGIRDDAGFMQISIPIQPGNSGGPVVTEDGLLVGIVSSTASIAPFFERTGTIPQNVNWAVHSSLAVALLGLEGQKPLVRTRAQAIADTVKASVLISTIQD
jgi:S1-C subfamily serine protease